MKQTYSFNYNVLFPFRYKTNAVDHLMIRQPPQKNSAMYIVVVNYINL